MKRVKSIRHGQRLLSAFRGIWPRFRPGRHLLSAADYRQVMADRCAVWNEITGATTTAAA
jgi:putative transposase